MTGGKWLDVIINRSIRHARGYKTSDRNHKRAIFQGRGIYYSAEDFEQLPRAQILGAGFEVDEIAEPRPGEEIPADGVEILFAEELRLDYKMDRRPLDS